MSALGDILNNSNDFSTINPAIIDEGAKIAGSALSAGFQGWGTFIRREILFQPGSGRYLPPVEYLAAEEKEPLVITSVKWSGGREGQFFIALPESAVKGAVAFFLAVAMGSKPDIEGTKLDNDGMDAYSELANTLVQQGAQKLRGDIKEKIDWLSDGNQVIVDKNGALTKLIGSKELLCYSGQLTIEGLPPATVYMLMTVSCTGMSAELTTKSADANEESSAGRMDLSSQAASLEKQAPKHRNESLAMKLRLPLIVVLAATKKRVESVKELAPGSIIEFRKFAGEFLDINAGNTKIAEGEVVIVNQHFGVQVRRITPQIPFASMLRK